ncbi:hypothetical protein B0H15DRAFT_947774 [Mycena belliarum]|uniref:Uncharacterized protein n=1 Tax=Mycena belliarum TaxID=1033014 RepID=A0AAD6XU82_9AGAR|nr:hypothetical protein B0H15DRAFT_947774 [Mycena belliae]
MGNAGSTPMRQPVPPLQARRIRVIALSFPILVVSGYTLFDRIMNQKEARAPPLPTQTINVESPSELSELSES